MSVGLIFGLLVIAALAIWGVLLLRLKIAERRSEKNSHHDAVGTNIGDGSSGSGD